MLRPLLAQHLWIGLVVVTALYLLDYQLSVLGIKWFKQGADEHYDLGGSYELNPPFEDDIEAERLVSKTHILALVRIWVVLIGVWWLSGQFGDYSEVYVAFLGFFVLTQMPVMLRHAQNLVLFRFVSLRGGVEGRATVARWLEFKMSAAVFWYFSAAYVLLWVLLGDVFFVGGAVGTALAGARFWIFGGDVEETVEAATTPDASEPGTESSSPPPAV